MNLQTMVGFRYFHFCINMLKWLFFIFGFRQKSHITFQILQPTETCKKVFAIFEVSFSQNVPMKCVFLNPNYYCHVDC
jgi:hypothetical protein